MNIGNELLREITATGDEQAALSALDRLAGLGTSSGKGASSPSFRPSPVRSDAGLAHGPLLPVALGASGAPGAADVPSANEPAFTKTDSTKTEATNADPFVIERSPTLRMYQDPETGGLVIEKQLFTRYGERIRPEHLRDLDALMESLVARYQALSEGPLDTQRLRELDHPYSTRAQDAARRDGKKHAVPRFHGGRGVGHAAGVRGSVGTLDVMNRSGRHQGGGETPAAESWSGEVIPSAEGVTLRITNPSPGAWFVASGTEKMIAHGPRTKPIEDASGTLRSAWARLVSAVRRVEELDNAL